MKTPFVHFVGAGPGAEDLITVRGAVALEQADVVVYAGSLVNPALLRRCKAGCVCHNSASLSLDEQVTIMADAATSGQSVVRLHTGDPTLYGAIGEQMTLLAQRGVEARITPGVSSVFGAAAALGCELTVPGVSQSVVLTRTPGRTPMPPGEQAAAFARTGATLAFFLSAGQLSALADELVHAGTLPADTPAAVVYRATWPDERRVLGTLSNIAARAEAAGIGRQAMVFVGEALRGGKGAGQEAKSRLYDHAFSHGYRNALADEVFHGSCALYAFTGQGLRKAVEMAEGLAPLPVTVLAVYAYAPVASESEANRQVSVRQVPGIEFDRWLADHWLGYDAHVFVGATGIAVRKIAPLLQHKTCDPAVLSCTETGAQVISLVSGHLGGANRLARRVARITGGQALVSTASDGIAIGNAIGNAKSAPVALAFDEAAARVQARVINSEAILPLNAALVRGDPVDFLGPKVLFERFFAGWAQVQHVERLGEASAFAVCWDRPALAAPDTTVLYIASRSRVLGVGCRRGVAPAALEKAATSFLRARGLGPEQVALSSCTLKGDEEALLSLARAWNAPLLLYDQQALDKVNVPHPSARVRDKIGTGSVAEASALLGCVAVRLSEAASGAQGETPILEVPKTVYDEAMTFALARLPHGKGAKSPLPGRVVVVGLGSGAAGQITPEVSLALERCDVVAGYSAYLELIEERIAGKVRIESGMKGEVSRCRAALQAALEGHEVAMVCSGDPGVLAMAGLVFELRGHEPAFGAVPVRVLPGITAASVAAASLGAPLQNGYSLISLSDLLVPATEIRTNVCAAAQGALPVALYNPAGRKRRELLHEALDLFAEYRGLEVWCALVRQAGRPGEERWVGMLKDFPRERVDMSTLVIIGGPRTRWVNGTLYEARGYADRYAL